MTIRFLAIDVESVGMELELDEQVKACTKCGRAQPLGAFHRNARGTEGRHSWCRDCSREYGREWRRRNQTYYWDRYLKQRFGLPALDYEALMAAQDGRCAICREVCKTGKRLAVDHDHATGSVRGLLCLSCNTMLGQAGDDPERLRAAAAYIEAVRA